MHCAATHHLLTRRLTICAALRYGNSPSALDCAAGTHQLPCSALSSALRCANSPAALLCAAGTHLLRCTALRLTICSPKKKRRNMYRKRCKHGGKVTQGPVAGQNIKMLITPSVSQVARYG
eukprot:gene18695-biopygen6936